MASMLRRLGSWIERHTASAHTAFPKKTRRLQVECLEHRFLLSAYSNLVLQDNPIAYWRLGENGSTTATNEVVAEMADSYKGNPTLGATGLITADPDKAVRLDGINDRVAFPDHLAINLRSSYRNKTIELWFKASDVKSRQVLFEQGGYANGLNMYIQDGRLYMGGWNTTANSRWNTDASSNHGLYLKANISAGQTYHAVLVMKGDNDGRAGKLKGYLNGRKFGALTGVGTLPSHDGNASVGALHGTTRFHDGNAAAKA